MEALWQRYREQGKSWESDGLWKKAAARLAGDTEVPFRDEAGKKQIWKGPVLSRANPEWIGKVIIRTYDENGTPSDSLSSTRQTRDAMYRYLKGVAQIP